MIESEALKARAEQLAKYAKRSKTFAIISLVFCIFWALGVGLETMLGASEEDKSAEKGFLTFSIACLVASVGLTFALSSARKAKIAQSVEAANQEAKNRQHQFELNEQKSKEASALAKRNQDREYSLTSLSSSHDSAIQLKQAIPALLNSTDAHLRRAEQEYERGAFSPFWESIESATRSLAELSDNLQSYGGLVEQHKVLSRKLITEHQVPTPRFPVNLTDIYIAENGQELSRRMDLQVAKAETNYQFASIYEQRRTSAIMVAGFRTLGNAISGMTDRITSQLVDVVQSVDSVGRSTDSVAKSIESASLSASSHSEEALRMLDNIQRRRLPGGVDREY